MQVQRVRASTWHRFAATVIPVRRRREVAFSTKSSDEEHGDAFHAAQHQVQHRVQEKAGLKVMEKVVDGVLTKSAGISAVRGAERATENIGRHAVEKVGERAVESMGRHAASEIGAKTAEKAILKATEQTGERAVESIGRLTGEHALEKVGERALDASKEMVIGGEKYSERVVTYLSKRFGTQVVKRFGQRTLIALPVLGGLAAMYICRQDALRSLEERTKGNVRGAALFTLAAGCDAVDAAAHFVIAYGLFDQWSHAQLLPVEYLSLSAASVSILAALAGELVPSNHAILHANKSSHQ